jgi:DNA-binding CsgD family transcriptional regulator
VDWSHALLTEHERVLFRRLAAFLGGFDLDAAQTIGGGNDIQRFQVLDLLTLLVDKSLVVAENTSGRTRYRLLETVRQYALEKLGESGEADVVRSRHRDHYTALAALLDAPAGSDYEQRLVKAELEIDNLRAAFAWSRENSEVAVALALASSLEQLWLARGHIREGLAWLDAALTDLEVHGAEVPAALRARALADQSVLAIFMGTPSFDHAELALAIAREVDDPALLVRALTACGPIAVLSAEPAGPYFAEAIGLARELDDPVRLSQILGWQARAAAMAGDPVATRAAGEEGRDLADAIGNRYVSRQCRWCLLVAQEFQGDIAGVAGQFGALAAEAEAAHDVTYQAYGLAGQGIALAMQGEARAARAAADAAVEAAVELGGIAGSIGHVASAFAALAAGDAATAQDAVEKAGQQLNALAGYAAVLRALGASAALVGGDLVAARRCADDGVAATTGWWLMWALTTRARVALAQGEPEQAERDVHDALAIATDAQAYLGISDVLECLAGLAGDGGGARQSARLCGAAHAIRQRIGEVRFKIHDAGYEELMATLRDTLGKNDFDAAWAEGAAMSTEEAIAYARRGRGQRKRPTSGWASLTPTERDVVRLVSEGLANNDIATRLFVSPRTVQTHLTHVYTKLGLTSRVQLAQEAARHS